MRAPILLTPALQHYEWGDPQFIPDFLQIEGSAGPCAEAWFGAHPLASATAQVAGGKPQTLRDLFASDRGYLGDAGGFPYLLKLLAAHKPLSIQVHPNRDQAREGFAREEAAGIPRDARNRCYRDDNHKPEILCALTPFYALCGFRSRDDIAAMLAAFPPLARLVPAPESDDPEALRRLLERYYQLDPAEVEATWSQVLQDLRAAGAGRDESDPSFWLLRAHEELSGDGAADPGLLFVLLLELIQLRPGQALFLPAGVPHAYLRGSGVELMASSDNVLRAGLTPKHVDREELLRVVRFDARRPPILEPIFNADGSEGVYPIPASEFELRQLRVGVGETPQRRARGAETLLVTEGPRDKLLTVRTAGGALELRVGQACLIAADADYSLESGGDFALYRVASGPAPTPQFRGRAPTELRFGTSGLRGRVEDITDLEAYVNTRGFLHFCIDAGFAVPGTRVALALDLRPSSERILRVVGRAARDCGLEPLSCGTIPTPALTHFGLQRGWPSIMVTGSHIPFDRNGIKFNTPRGEVLKSDESDILRAVAQVRALEYNSAADRSAFDDAGRLRQDPGPVDSIADDARFLYRQRYLDALPEGALSGLRLAFYQHSAVGRDLIPELLRDLGAEVLATARSDSFVAIDTEAIAPTTLAKLQKLADELRAEHGTIHAVISTDGDSDRPLVLPIAEDGTLGFLPGDALGALVAEYLTADAAVVPVSASDAIESYLGSDVTISRTRIGSPWVIAGMSQARGERVVGWEANGGFLTGSALPLDRASLAALPTRDAVLPLVAFLHAAVRASSTPAELIERLPARYSRSALLDEVEPSLSRALLDAFADDSPATHAQLARVFSSARGFGAIASIDRTDGLRIQFTNRDIAHVRPSGNAPQLRIYAVADSEERARTIADNGVAPGGMLDELLACARDHRFVTAVKANIAHTRELFRSGSPTEVIGAVAGTRAASDFWRETLSAVAPSFGAREALAFHEDLPVNQAFGVLLLWQRLRPHLSSGEGALFAFVFGEGSRMSPITEAECGQKPAISTFVPDPGQPGRFLSIGELALRHFVPVESYLRRSGFDGLVLKWGDEVQIPTLPLSGSDPRFADADIVRFVSVQAMTEDSAANKDWVGVASDGTVTSFFPRRPLDDMRALAADGLLEERAGTIFGGVNLGSIAVSRDLLDVLLEEFESEVNDPSAARKDRPDLDPQLFTALTIANEPDAGVRIERWQRALVDSESMRALDQKMPGVLDRLRSALDRFESRSGRRAKMVAMDFGEQFWGDMGQHHHMYELMLSLREDAPAGAIARALAGLPDAADENGNRIAGTTRLGSAVAVKDSVLIDAQIAAGTVERSVLVATETASIRAAGAFDIGSVAPSLELSERAGSYKLVSDGSVTVASGERATSVFLADGTHLLRCHEDTDLRDRANNYDAPIGDNALSFAEAHRRALEARPAEILSDREHERSRIRETLRASDE